MQEKQFNNLLLGEDAKWAQFDKGQSLEALLKDKSQSEKREAIKENEKPVPPEIQQAVQRFVQQEKQKGTKGRTIRRMVQRKFNITVI